MVHGVPEEGAFRGNRQGGYPQKGCFSFPTSGEVMAMSPNPVPLVGLDVPHLPAERHRAAPSGCRAVAPRVVAFRRYLSISHAVCRATGRFGASPTPGRRMLESRSQLEVTARSSAYRTQETRSRYLNWPRRGAAPKLAPCEVFSSRPSSFAGPQTGIFKGILSPDLEGHILGGVGRRAAFPESKSSRPAGRPGRQGLAPRGGGL